MGLFDSILEEAPTTTTSNSSGEQGLSIGGDDSNFLIIDDSNSFPNETKIESNISTLISSDDIPDSAISFFNEPVVTSEILPESNTEELLTISENITIKNEETVLSDLSYESVTDNEEQTIIKEPVIEEESDLFNTEPESIQAKEIENISSETVTKGNPNDILLDAIANLQKLLKGHEDIIDGKMKVVENKQEQITNLKQEIKTLTEEAKIIGEEKDKVVKMIDIFQAQKI